MKEIKNFRMRQQRIEALENDDAEFVIRAEKLSKYVITADGRLDILTAVDLSIKPEETLAIVGASGSGKSTLLGLLAGLDLPSSGRIWLAGSCLTDLDEDGRARLRSE